VAFLMTFTRRPLIRLQGIEVRKLPYRGTGKFVGWQSYAVTGMAPALGTGPTAVYGAVQGTQEAWFVYAVFRNDGGGAAESVAAHVTFADDTGSLMVNMLGRWAGADPPSVGGNKPELNEATLEANGNPHGLDVAFRDQGGGFLHALNNVAQAWAPGTWQHPPYRLHYEDRPYPQEFGVEIRLLSGTVDQRFKFRLIDRGPEQPPEFENRA
jgi:hypothetical protein